MIEQILVTLGLCGLCAEPYFFRTSDGIESDLVLDWAGERWAIEIKLTSDPTRSMIQSLQKAADLIGASRRILICKTVEEIRSEELLVTNLPLFLEEMAKMSKAQKALSSPQS